ncbi:hypothetical protein H0H92_001832 [Tricholoma furcatifolium]|nr:hypothetical protein H0H92_001832 [Tricholoma furcatifolium]
MPLRLIRAKVPRVNTQDVLSVATAAAASTKELSNMSCIPPAAAAVSIALLILQTVQMDGKWDSAPPTLLRNLEKFRKTLSSIHEFMTALSDITWMRRFMKKATIDNAIQDYSGQLDDAAQSFQIATLIDIHYAVSNRFNERQALISDGPSQPPSYSSRASDSTNSFSILESESRSDSLPLVESPVEAEGWTISDLRDEKTAVVFAEPEDEEYEIVSDDVMFARGFRRYHQSEVHLRGKSKLKNGWWAGASPVEVDGRPSLIKRYEGPTELALRAWMEDVKILQNVL